MCTSNFCSLGSQTSIQPPVCARLPHRNTTTATRLLPRNQGTATADGVGATAYAGYAGGYNDNNTATATGAGSIAQAGAGDFISENLHNTGNVATATNGGEAYAGGRGIGGC